MTQRLRALWWRLASGLWFVPTLMVLGALALAVGLIQVEGMMSMDLGERWPRLFGAGGDGSRAMLTAIATSMSTVAGVVFSVTVVALSLAASQYSPRVLRTFTSDRPTQVVLGAFVGIFAYCLVVLRTIRGGDSGFVPSVAVLGGLVLALFGIGLLVFFIHHLAASIQASSIVARVARATQEAIEHLFPEELAAPAPDASTEAESAGPWTPLCARRTGYIISVSTSGLVGLARRHGRVLRMDAGIGDFVIEGQVLASLRGGQAVSDADEARLGELYSFAEQRTIEQDAAYGMQQIVDIGSKALSPGINDASTAVLCIDRLTQLLMSVATRQVETPLRREGDELRVIARGVSFADLVDLAYRALGHDAAQQPLVMERLLASLERVAAVTDSPGRRAALRQQAAHLADHVREVMRSPERHALLARAARLEGVLSAGGGEAARRAGAAGNEADALRGAPS